MIVRKFDEMVPANDVTFSFEDGLKGCSDLFSGVTFGATDSLE